MRRIENPYKDLPGYDCFGCSPHNPIGLKMTFTEDGEEIVSYWQANKDMQGWNGVLHGGIQQALMDEIASWVVFVKLKTGGVTSRMESRFKRPVQFAEGDQIILRAILKETKRNIAFIKVQLFDAKQQLCSEADVQYFTYPEKVAKALLNYPDDYQKFFETS